MAGFMPKFFLLLLLVLQDTRLVFLCVGSLCSSLDSSSSNIHHVVYSQAFVAVYYVLLLRTRTYQSCLVIITVYFCGGL
jgi:hypothetical protein